MGVSDPELWEDGERPFQFSAPAIRTPFDDLLSQYRSLTARIAECVEFGNQYADALYYFSLGQQITSEERFRSVPFDLDAAILALDCEFWGKAFSMTDVREYMPADKVREWDRMIRTGETERREPVIENGVQVNSKTVKERIPPFEREAVFSTIEGLLRRRDTFLAERVEGIWNALSQEHLTNQPQAFSRRMIMSRFISHYGSLNEDVAEYVHDLRYLVAKMMGRDTPPRWTTFKELERLVRGVVKGHESGKWLTLDGGAWKIRAYKVGTAHIEIHPEMAWRFNAILASLHPQAIPDAFRKRPKKKAGKELPPLQYALASFAAIRVFDDARFNYARRELDLSSGSGQPACYAEVRHILSSIGGVESKCWFRWSFDYDPLSAIQLLCAGGKVPEQQSHQFYETLPALAARLVEWCGIGDAHDVLEPEAGRGGIATCLPVDRTTCVEVSALFCKVLEAKGYSTVNTDFLTWWPGRRWDRICMNPPFADGRAKLHVSHAVELLSESGVLVACLPASLRGQQLVEGWDHEYSEVIEDAFDSTGVSVVLLRLTRSAFA